MITPTYTELNRVLVPLAVAAGTLILDYYRSDFKVSSKADDSPVTEADAAAEAVILAKLQEVWPSLPVIAEEMSSHGHLQEGGACFFLVDPLDGTKEFISKRDEFTVNIALIKNGVPVYGVIFAPALGEIYVSLNQEQAGMAQLSPAFNPVELEEVLSLSDDLFERIGVRDCPAQNAIAVISRSHIDEKTHDFLDKNGIVKRVGSGSSLKFCVLARGEADIYPRFGPTMEWDTAAGHGILSAAGGTIVDDCGHPFLYGKYNQSYRNGGFIACAPLTLKRLQLG